MTTATTEKMPDLSSGLCRTRLEEFEDISTLTAARAEQICRSGCPVIQACGDWGLRHERHGVWGGLSYRTLNAERKRLGIRLEEVRYGEVAARVAAGRPST